jgi:adenosylcobyric acid synthase
MIQGTTSNAGKSALVTALCFILRKAKVSVAPFKPQNMALNSAVASDGGEIGRAQAVQAVACGIEPHSDMNPILLKPNSKTGSQIIVQGKLWQNMEATDYHAFKPQVMPFVLDSFRRLSRSYERIIVEGAGSPAEINLREGDIANMGFAEAVDCPCLLVSDIDRGGTFAHLYGTLAVLSPSEQARIKGFIINKFRGDTRLLQSGIDWLEEKTGKRVLGVIPYVENLTLEAEDSLVQVASVGAFGASSTLRVAVIDFPSISNKTDFDPLLASIQVDLEFMRSAGEYRGDDLLILPGSKSVFQDFQWLKAQGWLPVIKRHLRYGGKLMGICGGFQMLGSLVRDPHALESEEKEFAALGLLEMDTTLMPEKQLKRSSGYLLLGEVPVSGYEIHMGVSQGEALKRPLNNIGESNEGAISCDEQIIGTYLHGIFEEAAACQKLLAWAGLKDAVLEDFAALRQANIETLARVVETALDMCEIWKILNLSQLVEA